MQHNNQRCKVVDVELLLQSQGNDERKRRRDLMKGAKFKFFETKNMLFVSICHL